MRQLFTLFLYFLYITQFIPSLYSQSDTLFNQADKQGLKQGWWKRNYPNGVLMYKGFFKDDRPVGEMRRYFETGEMKALLIYDRDGKTVRATLYYQDGSKASKGNYLGVTKDSTWRYYSYYSKAIMASEDWINGVKHGFSVNYYPNGRISERIEWKNGMKDGLWEQFFEEGMPRLKASYEKDKLSGLYLVYQKSGSLLVQGFFQSDQRNGRWEFYDEQGEVKLGLNYVDGRAENQEQLDKIEQEFFRSIDQNVGRYREPDINDLMPGGRGGEYDR